MTLFLMLDTRNSGGGEEECCKSYGVWNLEENSSLGMCKYATVQLAVGEGNSTAVGLGQMPSSCVYWGRITGTGKMRRDIL